MPLARSEPLFYVKTIFERRPCEAWKWTYPYVFEAETNNVSFFASYGSKLSFFLKRGGGGQINTRYINNVINTGSLFWGPDNKKAI